MSENSATASVQTLSDDARLRALTLRDIVDVSPEYPDEEHWLALLRIAFTEYGADYHSPYGVLLGMRACGAQLVKTEKGWVIKPRLSKAKKVMDPDGVLLERDTQWQSEQDYAADREALLPFKTEVSACLKKLG